MELNVLTLNFTYRTGTDAIITEVLENLDVYIMVVFNVDGYEYTWLDEGVGHSCSQPFRTSVYGSKLFTTLQSLNGFKSFHNPSEPLWVQTFNNLSEPLRLQM